MLWVADDLRGSGVGSAIMQQAEAFARSRGCGLIHLDTMSFQARGFYEKLGFAVYGTLTGFPNGVERYYLVKQLSGAAAYARRPDAGYRGAAAHGPSNAIPMLRLITYGLLAAFFFSSTFVLNRAMSLGGGHWVWSAALRYGYALRAHQRWAFC